MQSPHLPHPLPTAAGEEEVVATAGPEKPRHVSFLPDVETEEGEEEFQSPLNAESLPAAESFDDPFHDKFVQFQAILTILPMAAFASGDPNDISRGLLEKQRHFPQFKGLQRLHVVFANTDMACFADFERGRLYTSVRGTDIRSLKDLGNDLQIMFGFAPNRASFIQTQYCVVRDQFPTFMSFGCGHSLGGSIMHELAYKMEREPEYAFERVDVFNAGGSPLRRTYTGLRRTQFNSHRVKGDIVSAFYGSIGNDKEYTPHPDHNSHAMATFLPPRQKSLVEMMVSYVTCCASHREATR